MRGVTVRTTNSRGGQKPEGELGTIPLKASAFWEGISEEHRQGETHDFRSYRKGESHKKSAGPAAGGSGNM